jgi:hypothetical protein
MARSGRETVGTYEHDYDDLARPQFAVHHHRTRNLISDCRSSSKVNHHVEIHHDGWTRQDYALTRLDHFPRMGHTGLELVLCLTGRANAGASESEGSNHAGHVIVESNSKAR